MRDPITHRERSHIIHELAAHGRWQGRRHGRDINIRLQPTAGHQIRWAIIRVQRCCSGEAATVWDAVETINRIIAPRRPV